MTNTLTRNPDTHRATAARRRATHSTARDVAADATAHITDPRDRAHAAHQWRTAHPLAQLDENTRAALTHHHGPIRDLLADAARTLRAELTDIGDRATRDYQARITAAGNDKQRLLDAYYQRTGVQGDTTWVNATADAVDRTWLTATATARNLDLDPAPAAAFVEDIAGWIGEVVTLDGGRTVVAYLRAALDPVRAAEVTAFATLTHALTEHPTPPHPGDSGAPRHPVRLLDRRTPMKTTAEIRADNAETLVAELAASLGQSHDDLAESERERRQLHHTVDLLEQAVQHMRDDLNAASAALTAITGHHHLADTLLAAAQYLEDHAHASTRGRSDVNVGGQVFTALYETGKVLTGQTAIHALERHLRLDQLQHWAVTFDDALATLRGVATFIAASDTPRCP